MRANMYPGTCGCGARVAEGRGFIRKVGKAWGVHCAECPPGMAAAPGGSTRKRKASRRIPRARRARAAVARPRAARPASGKRATAAKATGKPRKARGKTAAPVPTSSRAAPATDWSLLFTPIRYGSTVPGADGVLLHCTPEYARIAADARAAEGARELDLLVTLVELRALGHLGEAASLPAAA